MYSFRIWPLFMDISHFEKVDCLLLKTISRVKCGFFGTFLYVEQYFIPKKSVSSWPSEGWTNQAWPNKQNQPDFSLVSKQFHTGLIYDSKKGQKRAVLLSAKLSSHSLLK